MDMTDKVLLNPDDSEALRDYFARLNPGDEVRGEFVGSLDENGSKSIVLSIKEIEIKGAGDIRLLKSGDDDGDEPMAIKVMKNNDGVPEQEGNIPSDVMPTH